MLKLLEVLIGAHFFFDLACQNHMIAEGKRRRTNPHTWLPWYIFLTAHASIHGAAVAYFTNNPILGFAEFAIHWLTDFAKCEDYIDSEADQIIHIGCKILWAVMAS